MTTTLIDNATKAKLVKNQRCFSNLTSAEIDVLVSLLVDSLFMPGDVIVKEGDPVDSIYFIVSGTADVRHEYVEDGQIKFNSLATLKQGDAIGINDSGFYSLSGVRTATVVANTDMVLLYLSVPRFHGFALIYPHVNAEMRRYAEKFLHIKDSNE